MLYLDIQIYGAARRVSDFLAGDRYDQPWSQLEEDVGDIVEEQVWNMTYWSTLEDVR